MGETKSTDYIPENVNEEYALLVGRLKAFEAWANSVNDYDFTKKMAFRMLVAERTIFPICFLRVALAIITNQL